MNGIIANVDTVHVTIVIENDYMSKQRKDERMNNPFDNVAQAIHKIVAVVSEIIVNISEKYDTRMSGMKAYPKLEENKRVIELHWASENITLRVDIISGPNPLSIATVMPDNANKELAKKLWEVSEIIKTVNLAFGGDGTPRMDHEE